MPLGVRVQIVSELPAAFVIYAFELPITTPVGRLKLNPPATVGTEHTRGIPFTSLVQTVMEFPPVFGEEREIK
jgi:hypothetical protein